MIELTTFEHDSTMDSREIAGLTGRRHDSLLKTIRKMLLELHPSFATSETPDFESTYINDRGQTQPCFKLPKRECLILAAGFNIKLRAAIIDRWAELESGKAKPIGQDPFTPRLNNVQSQFWNQMIYESKLNEIAGLDPSWTRKTILEEGTKVEQATGIKVLSSAVISSLGNNPQFGLDPKLPAHAAKMVIGSNFTNVSHWAKQYNHVTSTDINRTLIKQGFATKLNKSQVTPTELGREYSITATAATGYNCGKELCKGWNLSDKRFIDVMFPILDKLDNYRHEQFIISKGK